MTGAVVSAIGPARADAAELQFLSARHEVEVRAFARMGVQVFDEHVVVTRMTQPPEWLDEFRAASAGDARVGVLGTIETSRTPHEFHGVLVQAGTFTTPTPLGAERELLAYSRATLEAEVLLTSAAPLLVRLNGNSFVESIGIVDGFSEGTIEMTLLDGAWPEGFMPGDPWPAGRYRFLVRTLAELTPHEGETFGHLLLRSDFEARIIPAGGTLPAIVWIVALGRSGRRGRVTFGGAR